jgi:hypothetical protein
MLGNQGQYVIVVMYGILESSIRRKREGNDRKQDRHQNVHIRAGNVTYTRKICDSCPMQLLWDEELSLL